MKRLSVFVITIALIVGLVGCTPVPTQYNLTISSTEGGEVTEPGEETFTYDGGEVVDLVAKPDEGYRFVNWTGEVDTIANVNAATTTITMNGDYSITANFVAVYDLTISSTEGGSVTTPGEGVFTHCAGTVVGLAVRTDVGYHFLNWTGDVDTIADVNGSSTTITINDHYSITANFEEEKAVTFADPSLEAAIREAIYIPERPLYPSDLKGLTSLHAYHKNISDLTGLEYCTSLTALDLRWNQISDIWPLANLTNLWRLYLDGNQISDISPLVENEGLSEGDDVDLRWNPLNWDSINIYIPQLEARGVTVYYD